jgi:hypothetical protein
MDKLKVRAGRFVEGSSYALLIFVVSSFSSLAVLSTLFLLSSPQEVALQLS